MSDEEKLKLAKATIAHVLNAIADDARKYYLMGAGTQSYNLLTEAASALFGEPLEKIRADFRPSDHDLKNYRDQREEDARLIEIGRAHDTEGGA